MKITFIGAGSTVFARNVIGDCILTPELGEFDVCLFDIDAQRLEESYQILSNINATANGKAHITRTLDRETAFKGADFVVNAIQVGGYEPCTVTDFEIPKKYGLRQTIADTLGIGGIFRTLRTIPVMKSYADDMERWCPNALFLNYTNPMAMLSGYMQRYTNIQTVGLCHSVQGCASGLLQTLGMDEYVDKCRWEIAGINHQAWLLKIEDLCGNDLYPEIKRRAASPDYNKEGNDLVRLKMMQEFGYYITESSEHTSEYTPWFIKEKYPELIDRYKIPLDEYPRRCVNQINGWNEMRDSLLKDSHIEHKKTHEFASYIINAVMHDVPYRIHGNVLNTGLITNLPQNACVEVPVMVDRNGLNPCFVGDLPEQCAAINRTNINVQLLTIEAAVTLKKEYIYMAAMLDPHTASELSMDDIKAMCDDLIEAHKGWLPEYH
ncbi:MAG TPA: alpha-glucosidase/alpha-galactosidase [Candidatus Merdivicinus intestinigallinarum]|nr:alpha-glucosidase/alpha-galactosidase [Candidatus Merdivicinus intestinigallinarum]